MNEGRDYMRHDSGAKDSDGQVKRRGISDDQCLWDETHRDIAQMRSCEKDLDGETQGDDKHQCNNERLEPAPSTA